MGIVTNFQTENSGILNCLQSVQNSNAQYRLRPKRIHSLHTCAYQYIADMAKKCASTLNSPGHVPELTPEDHSENVRPEDSVSQAGSRTSRRSQASRSSSLFSEASAARI